MDQRKTARRIIYLYKKDTGRYLKGIGKRNNTVLITEKKTMLGLLFTLNYLSCCALLHSNIWWGRVLPTTSVEMPLFFALQDPLYLWSNKDAALTFASDILWKKSWKFLKAVNPIYTVELLQIVS